MSEEETKPLELAEKSHTHRHMASLWKVRGACGAPVCHTVTELEQVTEQEQMVDVGRRK